MTALDHLRLERQVGALLAPYDRTDTPGVAIGIAERGAILLHRQAGMASLELGVPVGPATRFRIASVSKQFTCAAILALAAEGRLDVADPVQKHLPDLPDFGAPVTLDHLMHNTSGLRDMLDLMRLGGVDLSVPVTRADLLAAIHRQRSLNFAPGTRYLYSNTGFLLLGLVAERVSGMTLPEFLAARFFAPLGMTRTAMVESTTAIVPGLATGYLPEGAGGFARAAHGFPIGGEGGLVSSVEDLLLWAHAAQSGLLDPALAVALEQPAPFANSTPHHYLRGLQAGTLRGVRTLGHGGLWPGYRTEYLRAPDHDLAVVVISNHGGADPYHLARAAMEAALEGRPGLAAPPTPAPEAMLAALPGRYIDDASGWTLDLSRDPAGYLVANTNGVPFRLRSDGAGGLVASRSAPDFALAAPGADGTLAVTLDARMRASYRRVAEGAALPGGLAGRYANAEIGATWTVSTKADGGCIVVDGPLMRGAGFEVTPVAGDDVRVWTPGKLFRSWLDVRAQRDATGTVAGLMVNAGRARGLLFARVG